MTVGSEAVVAMCDAPESIVAAAHKSRGAPCSNPLRRTGCIFRRADSFGSGMTWLPGIAAGRIRRPCSAFRSRPPRRAPPAPSRPFAVAALQESEGLPADITAPQLLSNMKFFAQSLGVRCTYCHVGEEGSRCRPSTSLPTPRRKSDRAQDAGDGPSHQQPGLRFRLGGEPKVTCFTCHRGSTKPLTAPPPTRRRRRRHRPRQPSPSAAEPGHFPTAVPLC